MSAPDRASRILAIAASLLFKVPLVDQTVDVVGPCAHRRLERRSRTPPSSKRCASTGRDQTLFVHASSWTDPFPYSPDVTTFLHQSVTCPWTGGAMKFDPETRSVTQAEPDRRDDEAIAREILGAEISDPSTSTLDEIFAVVRALDAVAPPHRVGLRRTDGKRLRQRAGGPVPSNRFR